MDRSN